MPTRSAGAWRRWTSVSKLFALACGLAALAPVVRAQETPPAEPPRPPTLAETLPQTSWDPAERGPLLVLDPGNAFPAAGVTGEAVRAERNAVQLAQKYGLQPVRYGTLTLMAPAAMAAIVPPDILGRDWAMFLQGESRVHPLLASLSPLQWDRALSEEGLAFSDLGAGRQRELGMAALGATLRFRSEGAAAAAPADEDADPVLSAAEANRLRLRLRRRLVVTAFHRGDPERTVSVRAPVPRGTSVEVRVRPADPPGAPGDADPVRYVPYRHKPTDLSSERPELVVGVPIEDAKTVGELVARLAEATGIELYVDRRAGDRPVAVRALPGTRVRAADLLEALCRGLAGSVRRVSDGAASAYVLTYDRIGLGVYSLRVLDRVLPQLLSELGRASEQTRDSARARQQVRRLGVLSRLPRQSDLPWPETLWKATEQGAPAKQAVSALPAEAASWVGASWERALSRERDPEDATPPLASAPDTVEAQMVVTAEILSPARAGVATIAFLDRADFVAPEEAPIPPVKLPARLAQRLLMVRLPETAAETERLVALAKAKGFTALCIPVPPSAAAEKALAALGETASRAKVGLVPALTALRPGPGEAEVARDVSATGRTAAELAQGRQMEGYAAAFPPFAAFFEQIQSADYLVPEAVRVESFAARAARLAALTGVVALALDEVAAPGYGGEDTGFASLWEGGYSPGERLAFLRAERLDPIDFPMEMGEFDLPFFRDARTEEKLHQAWNRRRAARRDLLLKRLAAALKKASIRAPLLTRRPAWADPGGGHWEPWRGQLVAERSGVGNGSRPALRHLSRLGALFDALFVTDMDEAMRDDKERFQRWLAAKLEAMDKDAPEPEEVWDGMILDLTDLPLAPALATLEAVLAPFSPPARGR